jgi:hypothetical protein
MNTKIKKRKWSSEEKYLLKLNYRTSTKQELLNIFPNRTWNSIKLYANKCNLQRNNKSYFSETTAENLLEESLESFYWLGFLFADGHFSKLNRIQVGLAIKDKEQIDRLATFLNIPVHLNKAKTKCIISIMNTKVIKNIKNRYKIESNKTYKPVCLDSVRDVNLLTALIIGFIDGDGSLGKQSNRMDCLITIKLHSSWVGILNTFNIFLKTQLNIELSSPYLNPQGYAEITWANRKVIRYFYEFIKINKLSVLNRKWNKINPSSIKPSRCEIHRENLIIIKEMKAKGIRQNVIAKQLGISNAAVSLACKRCGII